jgi:RHS repeat-associated protein
MLRGAGRVMAAVALAMVALAPRSATAQTEVIEYYAADAVGSTRVVFDPNGVVKGRSDYLPFGEAVGAMGSLPSQRFTGQERDAEAGLDNFNARDFAPRLGRLTSVDPVSGNQAAPQSWNRYAYVRNNPIGRVDPSGAFDGPVATPTTNCRQEAGAYWCPGSLFIPNPFDPSSADVLFNPDRQGYRGGEEMGMAEMQYGASVDEQFMNSAVAAASEPPPPVPVVTTTEEYRLEGATPPTFNDLIGDIGQRSSDGLKVGMAGIGVAWVLGAGGGLSVGILAGGEGLGGVAGLASRAGQVHGVLDKFAATHRTTAVLRTKEGVDILAGGGRDLSLAQQALVRSGEIVAKLPGAHAEITALSHAAGARMAPAAIAATRAFCPRCIEAITSSGGVLTGPTTAFWP